MQEIIWSVQPDLIIETGIAHGGSLIFSASMLELNAACGGPQNAEVLGVDIDIRAHNREAIEAHPMFKRISMIQGSSIAPEIIEQVKAKAVGKQRILVFLDSNHTHDHVLAELEAYARSPRWAAIASCLIRWSRTPQIAVLQTAPGARAIIRRRRFGNTSRLTPNSRLISTSTTSF